MLATVDQLELSRLQRPPGCRPGELAEALRALAFATSKDAARAAYHRVLYAVGNNHCGTYFPIVLEVIPFLGEILSAGPHWSRVETLEILVDLAGSFVPDGDFSEQDGAEQLARALRARIEQLRPTVQSLIADSSTADIRALVRDLDECLG